VSGGLSDASVTALALGEDVVGTELTGFAAESIVGSLNELKSDSTEMSTLANGKIYAGNASNVATEVTPSGEVTMTNAGVFSLENSAVTGQVLTGYVVGSGWADVAATDSVLESVEKLQGNANVNKVNSATNATNIGDNILSIGAIEALQENFMYVGNSSDEISEVAVNTTVTSQLLTGFVSGAGAVAATDSILGAIEKLDGNITNFSQEWTESAGILAPTTGADDVAIDTNTFFVDVSEDRVGIGTTSPTQQLELTGSIELAATTTATTGAIYKGVTPFIHTFSHPTGNTAIPRGRNILVGESAGNFTTGSAATSTLHASDNIGIGYMVMASLTRGFQNIAVGSSSQTAATSGYYNTSVGGESLRSVTEGYGNTAYGYSSLQSITSNSLGTALGYNALKVATGGNNTAVGANAMLRQTTGADNTAIGSNAGAEFVSGNNTISRKSVFIGYDTKAKANGGQNEIVIGTEAVGAGSNSVVLGNDSITKTLLKGNVGIGMTDPGTDLEIAGSMKIVTPSKTDCAAAVDGGKIEYVVADNAGAFWGCLQTGASTFSWVHLDIFNQ